jgi:SAM-dependent methyltransferase
MSNHAERTRQADRQNVERVYRPRHGAAGLARQDWHRIDVQLQGAHKARTLAALLPLTVGADLAPLRVLDVGCGQGQFLRQLIDWGATPGHLAGTEYQGDRLEAARARTAAGVRWHLGGLEAFADDGMDLVCANTVFSRILDDDLRRALAAEMWRVLRPGGWTLVFDFRHGVPRNPQLRRMRDVDLLRLWPTERRLYRSLILAPPLGRWLAGLPAVVPEMLSAAVPLLRSHFIYMARKEM